MKLVHNFPVQADVATTWALLTDVARVARCMPGATLDEGPENPYTGTVKIKVGAVAVQLRGRMTFDELDENAHRLAMVCEGVDPRGGSGAQARIVMELAAAGADRTDVTVTTEMQLSGKIAQFGQTMLEDVSHAILGKFLANLEREIAAPAAPGAAPAVRAKDDVIDLGAAVLPAFAKRYGAASVAAVALLLAFIALINSFAAHNSRKCPGKRP